MTRRRLFTALAATTVLCALIAVVVLVWPSSSPEAMVPAETPTSLPTAVDAVPMTRAEVVEFAVPGSGGVLYAHLLPDGLPGSAELVTNAVIVARDRELPESVIPGDTVLVATHFVGRGSVPTHLKVHPTTGMGVLVTPAEITEIEVVDGSTTHRAEAIDIGQGYRVFVVADLPPRPWIEDGPTVRPVR